MLHLIYVFYGGLVQRDTASDVSASVCVVLCCVVLRLSSNRRFTINSPFQYPESGLTTTLNTVISLGFGKVIVATFPPSSSAMSFWIRISPGVRFFDPLSLFLIFFPPIPPRRDTPPFAVAKGTKDVRHCNFLQFVGPPHALATANKSTGGVLVHTNLSTKITGRHSLTFAVTFHGVSITRSVRGCTARTVRVCRLRLCCFRLLSLLFFQTKHLEWVDQLYRGAIEYLKKQIMPK